MKTAATCRFTPVTLLAFSLIYFAGPPASSRVYIICACALVVGSLIYLVYENNGSAAAYKQAAPTVLVLVSMIYVAASDQTPWYRAYDDSAFGLLVCAAVGYIWVESGRDKHGEIPYVVRDMVYVIVAASATGVLAYHLRQLTSILDDPVAQQRFDKSESFLKWTTTSSASHNCTQTASGILFGDVMEYSRCPRQLWEQIRLDVLLTTQVYTTYTLTTRMRHDQVHGHKSLLIALAVIECISFCAVAVLQFDDISKVYIPQRPAMVFAMVGGIAWASDYVLMYFKHNDRALNTTTRARDNLVRREDFIWTGTINRMRPKLKL